jgi:peptide-methionine (S)-S-oxide reductase
MRFFKSPEMVTPEKALPGRGNEMPVPALHETLGTPLNGPTPEGFATAYFGLGCFWGAERLFFETPGVFTSAVGYQGGFTENPTYQEVCSGMTGHAEVVKVVFDPSKVSFAQLLSVFFEGHDPTQGYGQGNDVGTQYRSAIYTTSPEQERMAHEAKNAYDEQLKLRGLGPITTEIAPAGPFYYAEDYHQQYLVKVPNGYCGLGGTGVSCPVGLFNQA